MTINVYMCVIQLTTQLILEHCVPELVQSVKHYALKISLRMC